MRTCSSIVTELKGRNAAITQKTESYRTWQHAANLGMKANYSRFITNFSLVHIQMLVKQEGKAVGL